MAVSDGTPGAGSARACAFLAATAAAMSMVIGGQVRCGSVLLSAEDRHMLQSVTVRQKPSPEFTVRPEPFPEVVASVSTGGSS